jgi:hypothetical protein
MTVSLVIVVRNAFKSTTSHLAVEKFVLLFNTFSFLFHIR